MGAKQKIENQRPGFLVYYETLDALSEYTEAEVGLFVRAMGEYARYGVMPEFADRGMRGLWRVVQPVLARDDASYQERCRKNRYNSYLSAVKRRYQKEHPGKGEPVEGRDFLSYEDWISQIDQANGSERKRTLSTASQNNQNQNQNENQNENENQNITQQNENENNNKNGNSKGEPGETQRRTSIELYEEWAGAIKAGDLKKASELSNQLSCIGYITDPKTLEWKKRD